MNWQDALGYAEDLELAGHSDWRLPNAKELQSIVDASHELRTPISVILAKCQFALMRERSPEKYRESIKACQDSAQHLGGLGLSIVKAIVLAHGGMIEAKPNPGGGTRFTVNIPSDGL